MKHGMCKQMSATSGAYVDENTFFKLNGFLTIRALVNGCWEALAKTVQYNIRVRNALGNIACPNPDQMTIPEQIHVSESLQNDITYASSCNAALPSMFETKSFVCYH